jgi:hypothetical protein
MFEDEGEGGEARVVGDEALDIGLEEGAGGEEGSGCAEGAGRGNEEPAMSRERSVVNFVN